MTLIRYSALASPQLGLVDTAPNQKKCQKGYCYVHRLIVGTLLVFTCAIQILVCFRRDGFVGNLSRSNKGETKCIVEQHLIISHVMQDSLLITAYVLLVWYYTKWQPKQNYLVSSHLSCTILQCKNSSYWSLVQFCYGSIHVTSTSVNLFVSHMFPLPNAHNYNYLKLYLCL